MVFLFFIWIFEIRLSVGPKPLPQEARPGGERVELESGNRSSEFEWWGLAVNRGEGEREGN